MACYRKRVSDLCLVTIVLACFVFTESKTVSSSKPEFVSSRKVTESNNVFMSVAKSLVTQAFSELQEGARRNPRLGFNMTMPIFLNPIGNGSLPANFTGGLGNIASIFPALGATAQLGVIGIKGGILGIKAAVLQAIVSILFIVFLIAGIAYFACNIGIISCSNLGSGLSGLGGGALGQLGSANPFSRNGYDYPSLHRTTSAVYNAIDDGQKKFT